MSTLQATMLFSAVRLGDITTTYLNMSKHGGWESIEAVPFNAWLIGLLGYSVFSLVNLAISGLLLIAVLRLSRRYSYLYGLVVSIMGFVVLWNAMIYFVIEGGGNKASYRPRHVAYYY